MPKFILPAGYKFRLREFDSLPVTAVSLIATSRPQLARATSFYDEPRLGRRRVEPTGKLYLYLKEQRHLDTWVQGGRVPLNLASSYLSNTRSGTATPDEVRQYRITGMKPSDLVGVGFEQCDNVQIIDCDFGGDFIRHGSLDDYSEDGHVLCLSHTFSIDVMSKLGKSVCVEIKDFDLLRISLDKQFGIEAQFGPVTYTDGINRDHFTKSTEDLWQNEYRLIWLTTSRRQHFVKIPAGIAVQVDFTDDLGLQ